MNQLARLQEEIDKLHQQYDEGTLAKMGEVCRLTFAEHFVYRKWSALAQVHELISLELANWLSGKLGLAHRSDFRKVDGNGGWPAGVSDAEKVLVMALFCRLQQELERRRML